MKPVELGMVLLLGGTFGLGLLHAQESGTNSAVARLSAKLSMQGAKEYCELSITGASGVVHQIDASSNLVNWQWITDIQAGNRVTPAIDAVMGLVPSRFYKASAWLYPHYVLATQSVTTLDDFETTSTWSITGGALSRDDSTHVTGAYALRVLNSTNVARIQRAIDCDFATIRSVGLWLRSDGDPVKRIDVSFGYSTPATGYVAATLWYPPTNQWSCILLNRQRFAEYGGGSLTNRMQYVGIRAEWETNQFGTVWYDALICARGGRARPMIVLTFDDGNRSVIANAFPIMQAHGYAGTAFVSANKIGTSTFMTLAELRTLYTNGWDISNHTMDHNQLDLQTQISAETALQGCVDALLANGFSRNQMPYFLAYPQGGYHATPAALAAVRNRGVLLARTTAARGVIGHDTQPLDQVPCYGISRAVSFHTAASWVDETIANEGVGIFVLHGVDNIEESYYWPPSVFQQFCDYLAAKRLEVDVVPLTVWYWGRMATSTPRTTR
jgi:hypothetical protein